ncbi:MAG: putative amidoligase domain-containing protein [Chitinophagales bacterium]
MIVKFYYLDGDPAQKIHNQLLEALPKAESKTITIAGGSYRQFILPDKDNSSITIEVNEPRALSLISSKSDLFKILNLNKILTSSDLNTNSLLSEYKVTVLDLDVTRLSKRTPGGNPNSQVGWIKQNINEEDKELKKVFQTAKRTIQCLGLDFGIVHIGLTRQRRPTVINVDASPNLSEKSIKNLVNYLIKCQTFFEPKSTLTIGADPEFMMINRDTGKMIVASMFFPRFGSVGCDSIRITNREQRPIAELRPLQDESPLRLSENIQRIMLQAVKLVPYRNIEWLAGSQPFKGYYVGGHIHFSNIKLSGRLLRALDNYLGIPLVLLENPNTGAKRREKYGTLSDYRIKEYGGFEYRTLGSWLVSRDITRAALCLAWLIAMNYHQLSVNYLLDVEVQSAFYQGVKEPLSHLFPYIWQSIKGMKGFESIAENLQPIYNLCSSGETWPEEKDIRPDWDIPIPKKKYRVEQKTNRGPAPTRVSVRVR